MNDINAILAIAYRDLLKFIRDKQRIVFSFVFPLVFIAAFGGSLNANLSDDVGYNFLTFVFIGIIAQTLFQSSASGVISLIEDRENDFSQEIFVSPISRYSIIMGKVLGESLVALLQLISIFLIAVIMQIPLNYINTLFLIPFCLLICIFGASFGVLVLSNLNSQKSANQIFPFIMFPQFFLCGVFTPIKELPLYLWVLSRIAPMTYAVDLLRTVYYNGSLEFSKVTLYNIKINLTIIFVLTTIFIILGTYTFVKNERNK